MDGRLRSSDIPAVRACERVTVTRLTVVEGTGVNPDPVREVTYWYDDAGGLISRYDPYTLIPDEEIFHG